MSRTDAEWRELVRDSMIATWGLVADSTPAGRLLRRDGVFAAIVPLTPERSVTNSVLYTDTAAMLGSLDDLARGYDEAGVRAWTVWVPEGDEEAARGLEAAGHVLDAQPRAMGMDLGEAERPDLDGVEWSTGCDLLAVGRVNDSAYGYTDRGLESVIGSLPHGDVHSYGAEVDGTIAGVMLTIDSGSDTEIAWVATLEAARGRGLATALMRQALWDARERGQQTATLQATKLGAPVYERVGFTDYGELQMWERRR